ncbi:MAG: Zn-ribbon domain-containing OB-fold protein [Chloroflexi bacterium]|nr:Zn-ribbon domain-containing OB-fold protein [Chloroflexota bacterium]MCZ6788672.1 Zn-ribbon domain-containing OB-fold protein [Chloroflexota bacterium]
MAAASKPLPKPTPDTQPFWDAAKRHQLSLPKCKACGQLHYFPRPFCPHCFSWDLEWVRCSGKGKLYSYVINHRPAPGFEEEAPYVIAVVELDEGPRMLSNLIDIEPTPEAVQVDMPVEILFQDVNEELSIFKFRPA